MGGGTLHDATGRTIKAHPLNIRYTYLVNGLRFECGCLLV